MPDGPRRRRRIRRDTVTARWTGRIPVGWRILAVNVFVVAMIGIGLSYLESYRARLVEAHLQILAQETALLAETLERTPPARTPGLVVAWARITDARVRLYAPDGQLAADSFAFAPPAYVLRDPADEGLRKDVARGIDRIVERLTATRAPGYLRQPTIDRAVAWPELAQAGATQSIATVYRFAPDRTPFLSAAAASERGGILLTANARDISRIVRAERLQLGLLLLLALLASVLLSLYLARTIVRPLKQLMTAAVRVRLGRDRQVTVPRLPERGDEIGLLARAVSDMTHALRERIDAGERFAADVAHELKNPLASLRGAIDALDREADPALRRQLLDIAADDTRRLDRLVTDIAEASRMDAQLSRAHFDRVDLGAMLEAMLAARTARKTPDQPRIAFARPRRGVADVMGDGNRLERVFDNLIDNALSFTPSDGLVRVSATRAGDDVIIRVEDSGPGVAPELREDIFRRFHTLRPTDEPHGRHSGLGLAIARTIVEGHQGAIAASDRDDGEPGACFEVALPAADAR